MLSQTGFLTKENGPFEDEKQRWNSQVHVLLRKIPK
jgi:hypothetical protein